MNENKIDFRDGNSSRASTASNTTAGLASEKNNGGVYKTTKKVKCKHH